MASPRLPAYSVFKMMMIKTSSGDMIFQIALVLLLCQVGISIEAVEMNWERSSTSDSTGALHFHPWLKCLLWFGNETSSFQSCCLLQYTQTDLDSSCPGSLLETTPPPPGYPWISGGRYVTPEPGFRGLVHDHQLLKELEPKNCKKRAKFDQKQHFLSGVLVLACLNLNGWELSH